MLLVMLVLVGGGRLFLHYHPEENPSTLDGIYHTFVLVLGEAPDDLPPHPVAKVLFFLLPIVGLTVVIQTLVDVAVLVRDRQRNEREWSRVMASNMSDHIVLVGMGRLGYRAFLLLRRLGERIVVIERDPANQFLEEVRREGSPVFIGDGRRDVLLHEANIKQARAVICATTDDLANLEVALDAKKYNPNIRVVIRMFDQNMADKLRGGFNIHLAMSQSALSAPSFAMAAVDEAIIGSVVVDERLLVTIRWHVQTGDALCDRTIAEVMTQIGVGIVQRSAENGSSVFFPPPDTRLCTGDNLLLQGEYAALTRLRRHQKA